MTRLGFNVSCELHNKCTANKSRPYFDLLVIANDAYRTLTRTPRFPTKQPHDSFVDRRENQEEPTVR